MASKGQVSTKTETGSGNLERLAREARSERPRAFDRLASELLPLLQRWAFALVGSADDADDIAQEVLVKVHRGLSDFAFGSRVSTWAYAVTRRTAADHHRKRHRREHLLETRLEAAPHAVPASEDADRNALSELVYHEFRKLPGRQREVFDLADLQGRSIEEIARLLNLSPVTVRVHLHRARSAIRSRILGSHPALVEDML